MIGRDAEKIAAPNAALANGALIHALDFDDTHAGALVHATAAVLPAALAVGQETGSTGAQVLAAAVAGYEVVNRLGAVVRHGFHGKGFHATSVCGVFASALIASKLYGSTVEQTVNALGIAGSQAAGSLEFLATGSATKQLHPGFSGQAGIVAARLARAGATGPSSIFEGENGLYRAYLGHDVDASALTDGLGERWETTRITIKPYAACQLSHASLDALALHLPLDPAQVTSITFDVPRESVPIVCDPVEVKHRPRTPYEGKFSLQFSAASLVVDGALTVSSFEPAALQRPAVLSLAEKIDFRATDPGCAPADAPGSATVTYADGRIVVEEVLKSRGGPDNPMSDEDLIAKFVGNAGSKDLVDVVMSLESQPSVAVLTR